jgi:hypothetical protein
MTTKIVKLEVPLSWDEPEELNKLSPEENAFILDVGCETIKDARALVAGLSQKEIYNKIREESKCEIQKLEMDLLVEKEIQSKMDSTIRVFYEKQLENMKKQIEELKTQIIKYESQNKDLINSEVSKVELKLNAVIESKDRSIESLSTTYQNLYTTIQAHKSTSHKGKEGEQLFQYYADETFKDFKGYNLIDKHTQGGAGDFHMLFEDFDVLVDAKNYKKKVPIEQRDKIKKDLIKNEHIPFAWLVSLNTYIDKYDKAPVMYEWINTKQCIVYINNLTEYEDPRKILRVVWFTCKELYKFVEEINVDNEELQELKNDKFKLMDKIKNMRKTMREINTTLNTTRNMLQLIDDEFKEILSSETEKMVESNYSMFDDWWDTNIEVTNEDEKILSTDLWFKFKQDNKSSMKEFDVTTDKFKQFIKAKVPLQSIILKSKNANSAFEIKGIKWKCLEKTVEAKPIENLLVSEVPNKKTVKKIKSPEVYFDEEKDKTIIEDYIVSNDDIITLANKYKIKTYMIVSLLVRYKIIAKRSESRGYDKYKETEEYKSKIED